jgi:ER membrane protein complex subunit 4
MEIVTCSDLLLAKNEKYSGVRYQYLYQQFFFTQQLMLFCCGSTYISVRPSISIDLIVRDGQEGYDTLSKCAAPCGYSLLKENLLSKSSTHGGTTKGGIQPTTTQSSLTAKQQELVLATKRQKMAMSIALQPGQQIAMQAFMLYMSGNQLNMFSINVTSMAIITPLTAIFSIDQTFRKVQHDTTNDEANDVLQIPKLIYLALNLAFLGLGLYKMSSMRLLPTTSADWISKIEWKEMVEITSIPPDTMIL